MNYKDRWQKELVETWNNYHFQNVGYPSIKFCQECKKWTYRYTDSKQCPYPYRV